MQIQTSETSERSSEPWWRHPKIRWPAAGMKQSQSSIPLLPAGQIWNADHQMPPCPSEDRKSHGITFQSKSSIPSLVSIYAYVGRPVSFCSPKMCDFLILHKKRRLILTNAKKQMASTSFCHSFSVFWGPTSEKSNQNALSRLLSRITVGANVSSIEPFQPLNITVQVVTGAAHLYHFKKVL